MNKIYRFFTCVVVVVAATFASISASAENPSSILSDAFSNVLEGVFSKSELTLEDICGVWTADGSAVSFKSDNLLQKAGGLAAAGALESKLNPYYEKLGLKNVVLTINADGTFSLSSKVPLSGTVKSNGDGTFEFNFQAMKLFSIGKVTAYVTKSGNHLDVMFDATKLKKIISGVAGVTGISTAKTIAKLLDSYDGMCVGFSMNKTGSVDTSSLKSSTSSDNTDNSDSSSEKKSSVTDVLFDIFKSTGK